MTRVVVGLAGLARLAQKPGLDHVLDWALREAEATGARLVIVRAEVRRPEVLAAVARGGGAQLEEADPVLARAVTRARTTLGADRVDVMADRDRAGPVLVQAARMGDLVVVGAPTVSGWWGRGSTTYHVMTRAMCPVVAVHQVEADLGDRPFRGQVVVGADGSPAGHAAVAFAFAYADRRQLPVVAATTCAHPVQDVWFDDQFLETHLGAEPAEAAMLAGDIEPWHLKHPDVAVRRAVVGGGDAVAGLRRVCAGAALLVVGTAADRTARLGQVSRSLVERADCPVAVVRPDTEWEI